MTASTWTCFGRFKKNGVNCDKSLQAIWKHMPGKFGCKSTQHQWHSHQQCPVYHIIYIYSLYRYMCVPIYYIKYNIYIYIHTVFWGLRLGPNMPRPSSQRLHSLLDAQAVRNEKVTDLDGMVRHGAGEWGANGITINNNQHPPLVIM